MTKLYVVALISFLFLSSCASSDDDYDVQKVSSGIYYHQGIHQDASEANIGAIANVGFIIGERCVAVIDSGGSYLEGTYLLKELRNITSLPVCYVINTHVHPDHIFGNAAFKVDKPDYVGHEKLPAAIASREGFFAKTFKEVLGDVYTGTEFISPSILVSTGEPLALDLGNRRLILTAYSTSHTDHDLTVLDEKSNTLWTGDLLFMGRIPVMDGSINGWIKTMKELQTMSLNFVVPGHGKAGSGEWQQGLKNQLRYFSSIRDEIRVIIAELGSIEQASKQVGLEEKEKWELFDRYHRRNITASFVQLEWE